jgi:tRNA A37 N6-isopentenylltransferase MiaA
MNSSSVPPRFVPTLTEVVQPTAVHAQKPVSDHAVRAVALAAEQETQMVQRVLQRIDLTLERRLREAVGQLILEHTQTLAPRLQEEIERVVHQSVSQAFEQEGLQVPPRS